MLLIDTNVLVYAVSPAEARKQTRARTVLDGLMKKGEAALAVQNCAEFVQAAAIKPESPLELSDAIAQLQAWSKHMKILSPDFATVEMAVDGVNRYKLSFWDAMIWAIAIQHEMDGILIEDGPVGTTVGGIPWSNPFEEPESVSRTSSRSGFTGERRSTLVEPGSS